MPDSALTTAEIRELARAAQLELSDDEVSLFSAQLSAILAYFAILDRAVGQGEADAPATPACPLREDRRGEVPTGRKILALGTDVVDDCFGVPSFGEEDR